MGTPRLQVQDNDNASYLTKKSTSGIAPEDSNGEWRRRPGVREDWGGCLSIAPAVQTSYPTPHTMPILFWNIVLHLVPTGEREKRRSHFRTLNDSAHASLPRAADHPRWPGLAAFGRQNEYYADHLHQAKKQWQTGN